jgi:hypothetical protein
MVQNKPLRKVTVTDDDVTHAARVCGRLRESSPHRADQQLDERRLVAGRRVLGHAGSERPDRQKVYETSPMRQIASEQTIGTDALEGPNDQDEAGDSGWVGETAPRTTESTTPNARQVAHPGGRVWAMPKTTQKNLDDSQNDVERGWRRRSPTSSRASRTPRSCGDGVNKPRGF